LDCSILGGPQDPHTAHVCLPAEICDFFVSVKHDVSTDAKAKRETEDETKFCKLLKDSVVLKKVDMPALNPETLTSEKLIDHIKEMDAAIASNKQIEIQMKCEIGQSFKLLETKKKGKKSKSFIPFIQTHISTYSRSQIYFLINLHELVSKYNRLLYVTIGIGVLKSKFRLVKKLVKADPVFWNHIDK
jgi:hypothetical protein